MARGANPDAINGIGLQDKGGYFLLNCDRGKISVETLDDGDDDIPPEIHEALVAYGKDEGLICKDCGYGVRLCKCHGKAPKAEEQDDD